MKKITLKCVKCENLIEIKAFIEKSNKVECNCCKSKFEIIKCESSAYTLKMLRSSIDFYV